VGEIARVLMRRSQGQSSEGVMQGVLELLYEKVSSQIKITPGAEFRAAYTEGKKLGANIVLGDRPVEISIKRAWYSLSFWEKMRLLWMVLTESLEITEADIEKMKSGDLLSQLVEELSGEFPTIATTLLHERDLYLCSALRNCRGRVIVGVVGLGHLKGIRENWEKPLPDRKELLTIPERRSTVGTVIRYSFKAGSVIFVMWLTWKLTSRNSYTKPYNDIVRTAFVSGITRVVSVFQFGK